MQAPDSPRPDSTATEATASSPPFDAATYVDQTAALVGLTLPPPLRAGVIANFEHLYAIAQPVVEFTLPDTVTSAARFEP
jgi:hypothetical protein